MIRLLGRDPAPAADVLGRILRVPGGTERELGDRELVARIASGDTAALEDAYQRHAGLVYGLARRVTGNDALAEDVTQEVFVYLWAQPARFDASRGSLRSWLGMLAHRRSVDAVRRESRRSHAEARQETEPCATDIDDAADAAWIGGRVREAIDRLPSEQRRAVELAYFGGRTYREVATELDIPEGTAKSRLRLALGKLDELLRPDLRGRDSPAWT
jgi:RNA polymerase sigma-70 factor (ECF subfamily)